MKLIVGLGNPGLKYANNRHNIGFMCLSYFAKAHGIPFDKKQGLARIGTDIVADQEVVLARPQTYMNESGEAVSRLVNRYRLSLDDLIVIHDDMDLPLGKIRIRYGSSSGGHKGVESIIQALGSQQFIRVRVGIGRPDQNPAEMANEDAVVGYVLSNFTAEEKQVLGEVIHRVSEALVCFLTEGVTIAMNKYN